MDKFVIDLLNELPNNLQQRLIETTLSNNDHMKTEYLDTTNFATIYKTVQIAVCKEIPAYQNSDFYQLPLQWVNHKGPYKFRFLSDYRFKTLERMLNNVRTDIAEIFFDPFEGEILLLEFQFTTKKYIDTVINL
jgi:hypothetical protein